MRRGRSDRGNAPRKLARTTAFSPFRVLNNDCLDAVAEFLIEDLVDNPHESMKNFMALCYTTRWKPSREVYLRIIEKFTIPGYSEPKDIIRSLDRRFDTALEYEDWEHTTVLVLSVILHTLNRADNPFRVAHPFLTIPRTVDDWKHAGTFFSQMHRANFSAFPNWTDEDTKCVFEALNLCMVALNEDETSMLKECRQTVKSLATSPAAEHVDEWMTNHPFLVSRNKCTLILSKWPRLWCDQQGRTSPALLKLLEHDPKFLCAYDAYGVPTTHAIFVSGFFCDKTFDYLTTRDEFQHYRRTLLQKNTYAHALASSYVSMNRITAPMSHLAFRSKRYIAKRMFELHHPNSNVFCRLNVDYLQPWQLAGRLISSLVDKMEDPSLDNASKSSLTKTVDLLRDVSIMLRMCTVG